LFVTVSVRPALTAGAAAVFAAVLTFTASTTPQPALSRAESVVVSSDAWHKAANAVAAAGENKSGSDRKPAAVRGKHGKKNARAAAGADPVNSTEG
jgi:hypothetical protein